MRQLRRLAWCVLFTAQMVVFIPPHIVSAEGKRLLHPIHASITTVEFNPKAHTLEIACKVFADDLEEAIKKTTGTQLYLGSSKEPRTATAVIEEYLRRHVQFTDEAKKPFARWKFVGRETEGDAVWCYLEVPNVQFVKQLTLSNTILLDLHDDQTNLVNVSVGAVRRSAVIRKGKDAETLQF
jgi:hypothetical protein